MSCNAGPRYICRGWVNMVSKAALNPRSRRGILTMKSWADTRKPPKLTVVLVFTVVLDHQAGQSTIFCSHATDLIHIVMFLQGNSNQKLSHWVWIMWALIKQHAHHQTSKWHVQTSSGLDWGGGHWRGLNQLGKKKEQREWQCMCWSSPKDNTLMPKKDKKWHQLL